MKIKIITDSACDIPLSEKLSNVEIMNFHIAIDGKDYEERKSFTMEEFYDILEKSTNIPTTSHITMMDFNDKYCQMYQQGVTDVIHVTISGTGSATYNAAVMAKKMFEEENPDSNMTITIIDSKTYSIAYGYPVICADKMIEEGANREEIIAFLEDRFSNTEILLGTFSLKFMRKSGRISAASAFAGELMGFRPLILMKNGSTEVVQKVRGDKMILTAMATALKEKMKENSDYYICFTDQASKQIVEICTEVIGKPPVSVCNIGSAVAINAGPHSFGVAYQAK